VSVVGSFPSAQAALSVRPADVSSAVQAGATEGDVVLNRTALPAGDEDLVQSELTQLRFAPRNVVLNVTIETSELGSTEAIRRAGYECGADFVKTSTGKSRGGAMPQAVLVIAEVGRPMAHSTATPVRRIERACRPGRGRSAGLDRTPPPTGLSRRSGLRRAASHDPFDDQRVGGVGWTGRQDKSVLCGRSHGIEVFSVVCV
jgi:hypothetical protein